MFNPLVQTADGVVFAYHDRFFAYHLKKVECVILTTVAESVFGRVDCRTLLLVNQSCVIEGTHVTCLGS